MISVQLIPGSTKVLAPIRDRKSIIVSPATIRIIYPERIQNVPSTIIDLLFNIRVRSICTALDLYTLRPRIIHECPGYRFAYTHDVVEVLQKNIDEESANELISHNKHPLELIVFPFQSFEVVRL